MNNLELRNNLPQQRYEALLGNQVVAFAEYRPITGALMFTHTEVNENVEGQGIGSQLVRFALQDTQQQNLMAIPMCPFVAAFIQRNLEEFIGLVHPMHRRIFGL